MTTILERLDGLIEALGAGLQTDEQRERLSSGVEALCMAPTGKFDQSTFNKITLPVFTRTVYDGHGFDIQVETYVEKLREFLESCDINFDKSSTPAERQNGIDAESEALEQLTGLFKSSLEEA